MEKNSQRKKQKVKILPLISILQGLLVCVTFEASGLGQSKTNNKKGNKTGGNILLKHHDWLLSQVDSSCWSSVDGKVATHRFPSTFCAGHAWHSPGTAPPCPAQCALPTPPPDTGHKVGHAWQHSTGTSPPCPVQCALLTPPDTGQKAGHAWHNPRTPPPTPRAQRDVLSWLPHLTQDRMQVMHDTVQVQLPMPSTMCSPNSSTWQDKKKVMHDTVQVHICLCPAPPLDTGQKTGHAWHSPGTTPLCSPDSSTRHRRKSRPCMTTQSRYSSPGAQRDMLSWLFHLTQDKKQVMHDTVQVHLPCARHLHLTQDKKQAMHDNTVQVQLSLCPAWRALLTSIWHRIQRSTSFISMQESFWWWHCYSIGYSLPLPPPPGISVPISISLEKIQR